MKKNIILLHNIVHFITIQLLCVKCLHAKTATKSIKGHWIKMFKTKKHCVVPLVCSFLIMSIHVTPKEDYSLLNNSFHVRWYTLVYQGHATTNLLPVLTTHQKATGERHHPWRFLPDFICQSVRHQSKQKGAHGWWWMMSHLNLEVVLFHIVFCHLFGGVQATVREERSWCSSPQPSPPRCSQASGEI